MDRSEDAACDQVALNLSEPQLDLIEPGGVGRCEVKLDPAIVLQELVTNLVLWADKLSRMM